MEKSCDCFAKLELPWIRRCNHAYLIPCRPFTFRVQELRRWPLYYASLAQTTHAMNAVAAARAAATQKRWSMLASSNRRQAESRWSWEYTIHTCPVTWCLVAWALAGNTCLVMSCLRRGRSLWCHSSLLGSLSWALASYKSAKPIGHKPKPFFVLWYTTEPSSSRGHAEHPGSSPASWMELATNQLQALTSHVQMTYTCKTWPCAQNMVCPLREQLLEQVFRPNQLLVIGKLWYQIRWVITDRNNFSIVLARAR